MADDLEAPDGPGFLAGVGEPQYGDDPDSGEISPLRTDCASCGFEGGDCALDPDDCGMAKLMAKRAAKIAASAHDEDVVAATPVTNPVSAAPEPRDEGGVWVTYYSPESEDYTTSVSVHRDELAALRVAVEYGHKAIFLKWGEEL